MKQVILTFLLTTLLWWTVSTCTSDKGLGGLSHNYDEAIWGAWEPVEEAECNLSFSKYGVMTREVGLFGGLNLEYPYSIDGDIVTISQKSDDKETEKIDFRVVVKEEEDGTYLEIYGVTQLSGLYRKKVEAASTSVPTEEVAVGKNTVVAKPQEVTPSAKNTTTKRAQPSNPKPKVVEQKVEVNKVVEQPKAEQQTTLVKILSDQQPSLPHTKTTSSPEPALSAAEEIVGKWQPVEGAEYPLEFTKYGAVIQNHKSFKMRYEYAINGQKMKIRYDDASFKILKEGGETYLEIYNSTDFSGRYKRVSRPQNITATILSKSEYPTLIVGKWTPINGQEYPIEFTQFGTVIQNHRSFDMRYEYSLSNNKLSIRYDRNARVVISEDANNYYLEIFNTTDFSGRYKKSK